MALIACPDCQKELSTTAPNCPHCGRPMKPALSRAETVAAVKWQDLRGGLGLAGLLLGGIAGFLLRPGFLGIQPMFEHVVSLGAYFPEGSIARAVSQRGFYQTVGAAIALMFVGVLLGHVINRPRRE